MQVHFKHTGHHGPMAQRAKNTTRDGCVCVQVCVCTHTLPIHVTANYSQGLKSNSQGKGWREIKGDTEVGGVSSYSMQKDWNSFCK